MMSEYAGTTFLATVLDGLLINASLHNLAKHKLISGQVRPRST